MMNAIYFRWSDGQGEHEEYIAKANLTEGLQKWVDQRTFFLKKVTEASFDYDDIVSKIR